VSRAERLDFDKGCRSLDHSREHFCSLCETQIRQQPIVIDIESGVPITDTGPAAEYISWY
jgi:hypothetical protein